ncbi:MAG: uracil-DNA glycosylase [Gemmatimonadota bacterium]
MSGERALLLRYLRQLGQVGGDVLWLDDMRRDELRRAVRAWGSQAAGEPAAGAMDALKSAVGAGTRPAPPQGAATAAGATRAVPFAAPSASAPALRVLAADAQGCTRCGLAEGRTNVVFGEGATDADLVVVGEAPGREEDASGRPFVGRAGKMLDLLLLSAGFPRERVYICNVLKCRPPQNRDPRADEVAACTTTWLHAQLEAIAPRALLAVGKFAAQTLAGSEESIGSLRRRVHAYRGTPLIVTYHPAYLLRSPHMVRTAWQDVQRMRQVLDEAA